jgi:hypothetical protein
LTFGTFQFLGSSLVSSSSRKQSSVAHSTTEAEYVVAANCLSVRNVVPTLTSNKRRGLSLNGRC